MLPRSPPPAHDPHPKAGDDVTNLEHLRRGRTRQRMSSDNAHTTRGRAPLAPQSRWLPAALVDLDASHVDSRETFRGEDSERNEPE